MQVSGSFLESRTAKIDAPVVCTQDSTRRLQEIYSNRTGCLELAMIMPVRTSQRRSTLLSVAFARASAIGLPSPASFSHSHNKWRGSSDLMSETGYKSDLFF